MGGMSASDAAPLPRLGEVFFDVRGNSRSMRLSWYADTGVAVLSIWQGGMCTGTFRLAIADLPRMVETLQHGPGGQRPQWDSEAPGQAFAQVPRVATATGQVQAMQPLPGQGLPDQDYRARSAQYETQYLTEAPGDPRAGTGEPPRHGTVPPDYLAEPSSGRRPAPPSHRSVPPGYLPDDPRTGATPRPGEPPEYLPTPEYPPAPPEYLPAPPDHRTRPPEHAASAPDYLTGPPGYPAKPPDPQAGYLADRPGTGQAGPAGYDTPLDAGRHSGTGVPGPAASPPDAGRHSGTGVPGPGASPVGPGRHSGADASPPYPRGAGYQDVLADDPYLGGTGAVDYPGPPFPPGTSAPGHGEAAGPGAADYPEHYGDDVTGDALAGPAPDSAPYDRPPGRRGAASRHAAPDTPLD